MSGLPPPRKADPTRFQLLDSMPEDAAQDQEFLNAVQDLEDQQTNRSGFMFQKGALDKGDLIYLRDEEARRRHIEQEAAESERASFLSARAALDAQEERRQRAAAAAAAGPARRADADKGKRRFIPTLKVRQADKRPKAEAGRSQADASDTAAASAKAAQQQQEGSAPGQQQQAADAPEVQLPGLLGDYGSSSSGSEAEQEQPAAASGPGRGGAQSSPPADPPK